jgi:serine/threonine protein kinase
MTASPTLVARRYSLREPLGVGGMGRVWRARDEILGRDVAIKEIVLPAELIAEEHDAVRRRMLREARAAARLSHPNVVRVYDAFEADERPWIVMEYVPSRSLHEVVETDGPLEPQRVAEIGLAVVAALKAAHRAGVQHRDVKPGNVLLANDGRVVLTDFGIATVEGDAAVTRPGLVLGSPEYIAPERARDGVTGPASDLWSLGATLYSAVEGRSPYKRPSVMETLVALAADEPDPPQRAGVLQPVLSGLLSKDPAARIGIAETERRLRTAAAGEWVARRSRRPAITRRRLAVAVAVLLLGAVSWLAATHWPGSSGRSAAPAGANRAATAAGPNSTPTTSTAPTTSPAPTSARPGGQGAAAQQRPALPAGWQDYHDSTGFSVYVPAGWSRSRTGSIMYFRDQSGSRILGIDQSNQPKSDPVADWRGQSSYRVSHGDFPGYQEIHIIAVPYWQKAADWEFTYTKRVRQHVNNRGLVVSASQAYGIYWETSDADWAAAQSDLQLIYDSFRPAA